MKTKREKIINSLTIIFLLIESIEIKDHKKKELMEKNINFVISNLKEL